MRAIFEPDKGSVTYGEHTADIWMEANGRTPEEVLSRMLEGLYGTIADSYILDDTYERFQLRIGPKEGEEVLIRFLSEALFLMDAGDEIIMDLDYDLKDPLEGGVISLTVAGKKRRVQIPPASRGMEVKAITRHGALFEAAPGGWKGRVLMDI